MTEIMSTQLANDLDETDLRVRYDNQVKIVLSNKPVLARILKYSVKELMDESLSTIEGWIGNDIEISKVAVAPGFTNTKLNQTENVDKARNEGKIKFDLKFSVFIHNKHEKKIIINVEAQQKGNPGYDLCTRAIYYASRLISSQLGVEFQNNKSDPKQYDNIKDVYTIWICMDCTKDKQDTIAAFNIMPEMMFPKEREYNLSYRYDILHIVMIHLSKKGKESVNSLIGMLDVLLGNEELKRKKRKLQDKYNLLMSINMENEVSDMCNLSQGIVEDTTREVTEKVTREVTREVTKKNTIEYINNIMESMGCSIEQAMKALKINPDEYAMYKELMGM